MGQTADYDQSCSISPMPLRDSVLAEGFSLLYIAIVAAAAVVTGLSYLLFPELGALAHDVMKRPWGKWSSQPLRLIATPALTAVVGTIVTRHLPYNVLTILLIVASSLAILFILRSAIAPAISAGVLPLVLHVTSWLYPLSVLGDVIALVAILSAWRKFHRYPTSAVKADVDEILETVPRPNNWLIALLFFVAVMGLAAQISGLRLILFPPLIVMAYEMFGHPDTCPWAGRPVSFPVACVLTASGGLFATIFLHNVPLAAACSMAWSVVVLRVFDVHMPPALAIGLLPLVMDAPNMKYPLSVAVGTSALTVFFLLWRRTSPISESEHHHRSADILERA